MPHRAGMSKAQSIGSVLPASFIESLLSQFLVSRISAMNPGTTRAAWINLEAADGTRPVPAWQVAR